MRIDPKSLIAPFLALLILVLVLTQTMQSIRQSGMWRTRPREQRRADNPYGALDDILANRGATTPPENLRDPFAFGNARVPVAVVPSGPRTTREPAPSAPVRPVLTSIIFDADPRATIRYGGRDFSVRENSLFADFRVAQITNSQVTLDRNGELLVLTLRRGE